MAIATKPRTIEHMVHRCAHRSRMPKRATELTKVVGRLRGKELRRVRALMRESGLPGYMALRAAEIAHFNPDGAMCIVNSMLQLFRPEVVAAALEQENYLEKLSARADRHRNGGNALFAEKIDTHLRGLHEYFRKYPDSRPDRLGLIDVRVREISSQRPRFGFVS